MKILFLMALLVLQGTLSSAAQNECNNKKCTSSAECKGNTYNYCLPDPADGPGKCCKQPCDPLVVNGVQLFCGRGGVACPATHSCITDPLDRYAFCCPKTTT